MHTKKHSALFILVLVVGMLVNARDADARSYASLDEPIGEGLAVAAAAGGNIGGAGLPLLWSSVTSRIGSGMYAAYCLVFCDERNTGLVVGDGQDTSHPVMKQVDGRSTVNRQQPTVNDELVATDNQQSTENVEQRTVNDQPSTANTQPPSRPSDQKLVTGNQSITYTVLGISENDLTNALNSLESRLLPQIRAARESARSNRSRSESNPRPTFLTLADTFSSFSPYTIPFADGGGTSLTQSSSFIYQNDKLGVASSTPTETLRVCPGRS